MNAQLVHGDLLDQEVDVIVNAWNRNIIPWWLLLPQGVSGGDQAPWRHWPLQGTCQARLFSSRRRSAHLSGPTAIQGDHPRRRNQHAVAGVGVVYPGVRAKDAVYV